MKQMVPSKRTLRSTRLQVKLERAALIAGKLVVTRHIGVQQELDHRLEPTIKHDVQSMPIVVVKNIGVGLAIWHIRLTKE